MYIFMQAPHVHVLYMYMMSIPALGNPQVGLADLRIESTIRTFCGFEDCRFPYTSQKRMRICGLNFNPIFLRI